MSAKHRLLLLADEVAVIDADLGSVHADAWLTAAVDAVAHALVDVADGAQSLTVSTPVREVPVEHDSDSPADRASCAAAATQFRRAHATMVSAVTSRYASSISGAGTPASGTSGTGSSALGLVKDVGAAMDMLATALQHIASEPGVDRHQAVRAQAHRSIRAAYRLVQPHGHTAGPTPSEDSQ